MAEFEGKTTFNKSKLSQRINLKELLGREPSETEKQNFVSVALDRIESRTLGGEDVDGKKFVPYSPEYADKKGVSRNSVDMFLTGGMLESLRELSNTKNTITIGLAGDDDIAKRSYNHQVGDTLPKRTWFGLTKSEAENIAEMVRDEQETFTLESLNPDNEFVDLDNPSDVRRILDDLLFDDILI